MGKVAIEPGPDSLHCTTQNGRATSSGQIRAETSSGVAGEWPADPSSHHAPPNVRSTPATMNPHVPRRDVSEGRTEDAELRAGGSGESIGETNQSHGQSKFASGLWVKSAIGVLFAGNSKGAVA